MRRRINRTQRNYIIAGLCMILVIMGVGYAAFSSQLRISGTSNITSNWSVKITDIQSKVVNGTPTNASEPTHTDTTATFRTTLTSPGDTMQYDVTVSNEGDIDAKLDKITVPESTNPAIGFEVTGIEEGSLLEAKQTAILTVTVKYNDVTEQPSDLTADLEVTLDYSQAPEGYVPPVTGPSIGGQPVEIVDSGDGLYEDTYESGRYVYKGANPNNYIAFGEETDEYRVIYQGEDIGVSFSTEDECQNWLIENGAPSEVSCTLIRRGLWRIISKEADGTYKILKNELLPEQAWDSTYLNNWTRPATLNTYLNGEYYNGLDSSIKDNIVSHTWGIGAVETNNDDLAAQIASENGTTWNGNIGLIAHSDYLRANSDMANCGTDKTNDDNRETCRNTDWMYISGSYWWTISMGAGNDSIWFVHAYGHLTYGDYYSSTAPRPAAYLKSDITLSGSGTLEDPYKIIS